MQTASSLTPYQVYSKVAEQAPKTIVTELAGTAFVYWLAGVWRIGAQALFWFFVAITVWDALHVLVSTGIGAVAEVAAKREGETIEDTRWLWYAAIVRMILIGVSCALLVLLRNKLWPRIA